MRQEQAVDMSRGPYRRVRSMEESSEIQPTDSSSSLRIRSRPLADTAQSPASVEDRVYRGSFACENVGRYFRSSKRRIRWSFGWTNLAAVRQGKAAQDCRREEHEVELVWSVYSGKTRVYWNKQNISNIFREGHRSGMVDFAFKLPHREDMLQMVAHSEPIAGSPQYDLLVDGTSFFRLPSIDEIGTTSESQTEMVEERSPRQAFLRGESIDTLSATIESGDYDNHSQPEDFNFRLSMAGLSSFTGGDEVVDELRSELYSPILESLRHQLTECLPQTEEMVSRAIINAFFVYSDSSSHSVASSLSGSAAETDPYQVEVDALSDAFEWACRHATRPDAEELALVFMQEQIDAICVRIRNEELSSDEASRILLSVAAVLGLEFASPIRKDTILLDGLPKGLHAEDLHRALSPFGVLQATAIAPANKTFGFCRFQDEGPAFRARDAVESGELTIAGSMPAVIVLTGSVNEDAPEQTQGETDEEKDDDEIETDKLSSIIPHLMAPLGAGEGDAYESQQAVVITPNPTRHSRKTIVAGYKYNSTSPTLLTPEATEQDLKKIVSPDSVISIVDPASLYSPSL